MSVFLFFSFSYGMLLFLKQFNAFLFRAFLLELKNEFSSVFIESIINWIHMRGTLCAFIALSLMEVTLFNANYMLELHQ